MTMNDEELKRRFHELRARDAKRAPRFDALASPRPRRLSPLVLLAPALAAAAGFVLWCGVSRNQAAPVAVEAPPPPPPIRMQAPAALPLDFLLETTPIRVQLDSDPTEGLTP